jgi:hypothetical protein
MPVYGPWDKAATALWARDGNWGAQYYIWSDNYLTRPKSGGYTNWASGQPSTNGQDSTWSRQVYVAGASRIGSPAAGAWYNGHMWDGARYYDIMCKQRRESAHHVCIAP